MAQITNPFHDLYLTEAIGPDRFVRLFSPKFVQHATALFQDGNVILQGLQGSGKTMLLNLLKPEARIAYHKAGVRCPVPPDLSRFIGAGINLRKSGVMDFGQLVLADSAPTLVHELALQYGDFLNYWIVSDLLQSLALFWEHGDKKLLEQVGINAKDGRENSFAAVVAADACWFGYLTGIRTLSELRDKIQERILTYRKYINLNLPNNQLPASVAESKSVVGDPIARVAEALRTSGVLDADVRVFIRIDQYEQLATLDDDGHQFGLLCQDVTHKALASRDVRVSYRIGTRHYAWPEPPRIFGTRDALENKRDYSIIDIDEKLRRKENARTWIFPEFALDIFQRRLAQTSYAASASNSRVLEHVFRSTLSPEQRAQLYVKNANTRRNFLQPRKGVTPEWRDFLEDIAAKDPLSAKFADAWSRQKDAKKQSVISHVPEEGKYPWDTKLYWKKERTEQALLQIASANKQQLIWSGKEDVLGLSGGNILVFLFICQHIWEAWLRDTRGNNQIDATVLPQISEYVQSQGILEASQEWLKKQPEGIDSMRRRRFLRTIGQYFYRRLTDDLPMSYPGRNGFSLNLEQLEEAPDVHLFLERCASHGDLYDAPHTSKHKGERRRKYYLAPILCPYFKIPYRHTKEPEYVRPEKILEWMESRESAQQIESPQLEMFSTDGII